MSRLTSTEAVSREILVRQWVQEHLRSLDHELRVCRLAERLFDLTRRWHELGAVELRLLKLAALVHDVGRSRQTEGHAKIGARMLLESDPLPLTATERRRLAFLTRYHRGRVPEPGSEKYLNPLQDDVPAMRMVLGLLRVADGLDSRTQGSHPFVATIRGRVLTFFGYVRGDAAAVAKFLGKRKKFALLETTLNCQVRTEWISTDRLALVS